MKKIERRKFVRKAIRMSCVVQFSSGITINGNTRDISLDGVNIDSTSMSGQGKKNPEPGEGGLLTLKFKRRNFVDAILVQCRAIHVTPNGIGLSVRLSELSKKDQDILGQIIATGKAEI